MSTPAPDFWAQLEYDWAEELAQTAPPPANDQYSGNDQGYFVDPIALERAYTYATNLLYTQGQQWILGNGTTVTWNDVTRSDTPWRGRV